MLALAGCGVSALDPMGGTDGAAPDPTHHDSGSPNPRDGAVPHDRDAGVASLPVCATTTRQPTDVLVYDVNAAMTVTATNASLLGTATDLGAGIPSEVSALANTWGIKPGAAHWLRVESTSTTWILLSQNLPFGFGVKKGSLVTVRTSRDRQDFGPTRSYATVTVHDDVAFYFGQAGAPKDLDLPSGVTAALGPAICKSHDSCGEFALYALDVSVLGQSTSVATATAATVGNYDLWHARTAEATGSQTQCADWFVADTAFAVAHRGDLFEDPASACQVSASSTLPGVHIELDKSVCSLGLQAVMAGVAFKYAVVVDADVQSVTTGTQNVGNCQPAHASGLFLEERIFGGGENYCLCDTGLCAPQTRPAIDLHAGSYPGTFSWDGKNWNGPSDTGNPEGAAFPAGSYTFEVRSTGKTSAGSDFEVRAALTFTLH